MPLFYFDVDDGDQRVIDEIGTEFPNALAAKDEAVSVLPDIARDKLPDGDHRIFMSSVRDESGQVVCRAMLSLTVVFLAAKT